MAWVAMFGALDGTSWQHPIDAPLTGARVDREQW
jgi:hypothetical protein